MKQVKEELLMDLLVMTETSKPYLEGKQWAVNAVTSARKILGQVMEKHLFITESNEGITVKSTEFLKHNRSKLGQIVRVRGHKDEDLEYWVEFSDAEGNVIRVSGFSWGYGGEGPNGLAQACETVGIPLMLRDIINLPEEWNWEVNIAGRIFVSAGRTNNDNPV